MKKIYNEIVKKIYPDSINLKGRAFSTFVDNLTIPQLYSINKEYCFQKGIGDNFIMISELGVFRKISKFKNMLEWEIENWTYQEEACLKDSGKPRFGSVYNMHKSLSGEWFRFVEGDRLIYGSLYSLGSYLYFKADDLFFELTNKLIPYKVDLNFLKDHRVDIVVDANGKEEELKALQSLIYKYQFSKIYDDMGPLLDIEGIVRIDDFSKENDFTSNFIFCSCEDLENVSFKHFLDDVSRRLIAENILTDIEDKMKNIIDDRFNELAKELDLSWR